MAKKKSNKFFGVFQIFFSATREYFLYLDKLLKYLAFPLLGQIIPVILMLTLAYYFRINFDTLISKGGFFGDEKNLLILFCVILIPLFLIFLKAFFDYIIAFSALNIMFYTVGGKKKAQNIDFTSYNNVIKRKLGTYIALMLVISILFIIPPLCFFIPITALFLCFAFQIFAIENDASAIKAIKRSFELTASNLIPVILMIILCYLSTYLFFPKLFMWVADKTSVSFFFANMWQNFASEIIVEPINNLLGTISVLGDKFTYNVDSVFVSRYMFELVLSSIIIGITLPFRCCCFTNLYRLCDSDKIKEFSKESEEIISRATNKKRKN